MQNLPFPREMHELAKFKYEVQGKGATEISKELNIEAQTIARWKTKEKWLAKGSENEKLKMLTRQTFMEKCIDLGMPSDRAIKLLIEGMAYLNQYISP